jgi:hypothetical protein
MGTIDRRSAFYDDGEPREETAIVASSTTSIEDKEEGVKTIPVNVPPGAKTLRWR